MKKFLSLAGIVSLMLIVGFVMVSCGGGGGSPSAVVKKWYTAVEKGDNKGIEATMDEGGAALVISMLEKAQGQIKEKGGIDKMEETIDGDAATVTVTFKDGSTEDYSLKKIDGKWKVTMGK